MIECESAKIYERISGKEMKMAVLGGEGSPFVNKFSLWAEKTSQKPRQEEKGDKNQFFMDLIGG